MDIFKFRNPSASTKMEQGEIVNDIDSKLWVERYAVPGEFELVAKIRSGVREILPIGSYISHVDTGEVMVVENHEINDDRDKDPEITITGRSLDSFTEQRFIGSKNTFPLSYGIQEFYVGTGTPWAQLKIVLNNHIGSLASGDSFLWMAIQNDVPETVPVNLWDIVEVGPLNKFVDETLKADKLGIKSLRPGLWKHALSAAGNVSLVIHRGVNRSASVVFTYGSGEVDSADYLWSDKTKKTTAIVYGKWVAVRVNTVGVTYKDIRMIHVDASDLDNDFTVAPTGADLTNIQNEMIKQGTDAIKANNDVTIIKAEVSKHGTRAKYRTDYNVGDTIMVAGEYNTTTAMVVTEHVEIEDQNGNHGYPTLAIS